MLDARASTLSEEEYTNLSKQLLNKLFRVTGPAKLGAAIEHVTSLLDQGGCCMTVHVLAVGLGDPMNAYNSALAHLCRLPSNGQFAGPTKLSRF